MRVIARLATLLCTLCFATVAFAHASLVSTEPADSSVLAAVPNAVRLQFNETVIPAVIRLIDADGVTRADARFAVSGDTIVVTLPATLPQGTQIVSYRVISQDGHPVSGSLMFSIGAATKVGSGPSTSSSLAL